MERRASQSMSTVTLSPGPSGAGSGSADDGGVGRARVDRRDRPARRPRTRVKPLVGVVRRAQVLEAADAQLHLPARPGAVGTERVQVLVEPEGVESGARAVGVAQPGPAVQDVRRLVQARLDAVVHSLLEACVSGRGASAAQTARAVVNMAASFRFRWSRQLAGIPAGRARRSRAAGATLILPPSSRSPREPIDPRTHDLPPLARVRPAAPPRRRLRRRRRAGLPGGGPPLRRRGGRGALAGRHGRAGGHRRAGERR